MFVPIMASLTVHDLLGGCCGVGLVDLPNPCNICHVSLVDLVERVLMSFDGCCEMTLHAFEVDIGSRGDLQNDEILGCLTNAEPTECFSNVIIRTQGEDYLGVDVTRLQPIIEVVSSWLGRWLLVLVY